MSITGDSGKKRIKKGNLEITDYEIFGHLQPIEKILEGLTINKNNYYTGHIKLNKAEYENLQGLLKRLKAVDLK